MSPALAWFIAGFILILAEFAVPGVILVFIGLGAWAASLTSCLGWTQAAGAQTAVFALSSLVLLVGLRRLFKGWFLGISHDAATAGALNEFEGRAVRVISPVEPGRTGKVEFKGAPWNASSDEPLKPGDSARIISVDGLCLKVVRAS